MYAETGGKINIKKWWTEIFYDPEHEINNVKTDMERFKENLLSFCLSAEKIISIEKTKSYTQIIWLLFLDACTFHISLWNLLLYT